MSRCKECDGAMTAEDIHYLEDRCEQCERLAHERLTDWRAGAHDPALDAGNYFAMPRVH